MYLPDLLNTYPWIVIILIIWEGVWKGIALWKSARNSHLVWFICILIFNTIGILPIIYIFGFSKKKESAREIETKSGN